MRAMRHRLVGAGGRRFHAVAQDGRQRLAIRSRTLHSHPRPLATGAHRLRRRRGQRQREAATLRRLSHRRPRRRRSLPRRRLCRQRRCAQIPSATAPWPTTPTSASSHPWRRRAPARSWPLAPSLAPASAASGLALRRVATKLRPSGASPERRGSPGGSRRAALGRRSSTHRSAVGCCRRSPRASWPWSRARRRRRGRGQRRLASHRPCSAAIARRPCCASRGRGRGARARGRGGAAAIASRSAARAPPKEVCLSRSPAPLPPFGRRERPSAEAARFIALPQFLECAGGPPSGCSASRRAVVARALAVEARTELETPGLRANTHLQDPRSLWALVRGSCRQPRVNMLFGHMCQCAYEATSRLGECRCNGCPRRRATMMDRLRPTFYHPATSRTRFWMREREALREPVSAGRALVRAIVCYLGLRLGGRAVRLQIPSQHLCAIRSSCGGARGGMASQCRRLNPSRSSRWLGHDACSLLAAHWPSCKTCNTFVCVWAYVHDRESPHSLILLSKCARIDCEAIWLLRD